MKPAHIIPNHGFPLNKLSDRQFEELLYRIFTNLIKRKNSFVKRFTNVELRSGVAERGRDCSLHTKNQNTGLIQCKKYNSNLSPKQVAQEIIKFSIHAILDKNLISDVNNFTYFFAASKGFSDNAIDLITDFNEAIFQHKDFKKWTNQVLRSNKAFQKLNFEIIQDELTEILENIKVVSINATDINGWLQNNPSIVKEFFTVPVDFASTTKFSFSQKITFGLIGISLLGLIYYFTSQYNSKSSIQDISTTTLSLDSLYQPTFEQNDNYFKILLLPFNPDGSCDYQDTNYERQLIERFKTLRDNKNLNLDVKINKTYDCPDTNKEAKRIGQSENADIVIWGHYDEKCVGDIKVRLRYTLVKEDYRINEIKDGDSEMQTLIDLSELRRGFLQEDLDYIFQWSTAQIDFKNGDFDKGIERLLALNNEPCNQDLLMEIGSKYELKENYDKALNYYLKMSKCENRYSHNPHYFVADIYYKKSDYQNAIKHYEQSALDILPYQRIYELDYLTKSHIELGNNFNTYSSSIRKLIKKGIDKSLIVASQGQFLLFTKDTTNAISYYKKAIQEDSACYDAYKLLSDCIVTMEKDTIQAVNIYKNYINLNRDSFWVSSAYEEISSLFHQNDSALFYMDKAIQTSQYENQFDYYKRGNLHFEIGNFEKAIADYSKIIELNDYYTKEALKKRIQVYSKLEMYDNVFNDYDELLVLDKSSSIYEEIFELCNKLDDKFHLEKYLEIWKNKTKPKELHELFKLVEMYHTVEKLDSFNFYCDTLINICTQQIANNSENLEGLYNIRGLCFYLKEDYKKATKDFNSALLINPNNEVIKQNRNHTVMNKRILPVGLEILIVIFIVIIIFLLYVRFILIDNSKLPN